MWDHKYSQCGISCANGTIRPYPPWYHRTVGLGGFEDAHSGLRSHLTSSSCKCKRCPTSPQKQLQNISFQTNGGLWKHCAIFEYWIRKYYPGVPLKKKKKEHMVQYRWSQGFTCIHRQAILEENKCNCNRKKWKNSLSLQTRWLEK